MPEYISMTEQLIMIAGIAGFFLGLNGLLRWVVSRYSIPPIDVPVPKISCTENILSPRQDIEYKEPRTYLC